MSTFVPKLSRCRDVHQYPKTTRSWRIHEHRNDRTVRACRTLQHEHAARPHRCAYADGISGSSSPSRTKRSARPTRSGGTREVSGRDVFGAALRHFCRSGGRGKQACEKFHKAGITNVINVEGGTQACVEAGLPVVRGKKSISLERQVRIVAGSIVMLGVLLGFLVHPALFGIPAFVGAGLAFAGITDTCGMGMILARMPWNRLAGAPASTCAR